MFGSLINGSRWQTWDNSAFESTTFSLSTAVPRPCERRDIDRVTRCCASGSW